MPPANFFVRFEPRTVDLRIQINGIAFLVPSPGESSDRQYGHEVGALNLGPGGRQLKTRRSLSPFRS